LAALRAFDVGKASVGVGLEVGAVWLAQDFREGAPRPGINSTGAIIGPIVQALFPLGPRYELRLEAGGFAYLVRTEADGLAVPMTWRGAIGVGRYF
jgi:hypothetical protein